MSTWSDLSADLIILIVKNITNVSDYIRFTGVCSSWRSAATVDRHRTRFQLPGLIIQNCFLPITGIHHNHHLHLHLHHHHRLSLPCDQILCGSHQGWLITIDTHHMAMNLLNPVTNVHYALPHITTLTNKSNNLSTWSIKKVVMSTSHGVVCFIYGAGSLAFCKLGDTKWTCIDSTIKFDGPLNHEAAIYYKGQFYVVHSSGRFFICEFNNNPGFTVIELANLPRLEKRYLVESGGQLLQILRIIDESGDLTIGFEVYKLDFICNKWVGVKSLGKNALFLGLNQSFSVSELDVPNIKGNCIYFTDDSNKYYCESSVHDMGVFNLEDLTIEPIHLNGIKSTELLPVWFTPTAL